MRIALLRQRYNPQGGAERFIERALSALAVQGVQSVVYTRKWAVGADGAAVICDPFYVGRIWRDWGFARTVCRALEQSDADLVQSHERIACCDVYRAGDGLHAQWLENRVRALGWARRLTVVLHPWHRYILAAERRLFASPRLRAVICNSQMVKEEIRRRFDVAPDKLHVIYNGVDLDAFHPRLRAQHRSPLRRKLGLPEDALVHLYVGGGFERKGVPALLSAFARSRDRNARLVIVGHDKARRRAEEQARALGVSGRVLFAGGQNDVKPWYGMADTFTLPTLYDPFPNAALEAMACGLPVVTSLQCGTAELIKPGENGFVCDALDTDALAAALEQFDASRAAAMGEKARETALQFGLDAMAGRLISLYRSLLHIP
jgi:UDP-glucose:(heptosyl)LPS alpha-1,3-glucosyltransferase